MIYEENLYFRVFDREQLGLTQYLDSDLDSVSAIVKKSFDAIPIYELRGFESDIDLKKTSFGACTLNLRLINEAQLGRKNHFKTSVGMEGCRTYYNII